MRLVPRLRYVPVGMVPSKLSGEGQTFMLTTLEPA